MESRVQELLREIAAEVPFEGPMPANLERRARRRVLATTLVGSVAVVLLTLLLFAGFRTLQRASGTVPADSGASISLPAALSFASREGGIVQTNLMSRDGSIGPFPSEAAPGDVLAWSPDGSKYVVSRYSGHLWRLSVVDVETSSEIPMASGTVVAASWSPDGSRILYASFGAGKPGVFLIRPDGTGRQTWQSDTPGKCVFPAWSPDGSRVACLTYLAGPNKEVYVMNADGSSPQAIGPHPGIGGVTWSPDGRKLAYVGAEHFQRGIFVANADGSGATLLVPDQTLTSPLAWSPDGSRIAFVSRFGGQTDLYVTDMHGTQTRLTDSRSKESHPVWLPTGSTT